MTLRRKLSRDGFTDRAEVVATDPFMPDMLQLCRHFRPHGPTNFQFRTTAHGVRLLEINPRISSSTSIRSAFGYNESAMAVEHVLGGRLPTQPLIRRGKAVRYTDDHIFYDDGLHL
jgi:carbamoyl-phosphate synthase large subunit